MYKTLSLLMLTVLLTAPALAHADVVPGPSIRISSPGTAEASPPARSLIDLDLYTTTLTDLESGMLAVGTSWTGSTAFPVTEEQKFLNEVSAFVRAGWRQSKTIFGQLSAPVWLAIDADGDVDVAGTVSFRGQVGTSASSVNTFGVDLEEEVTLWRRTDRKQRGDILIPPAEHGSHRGQGLETSSTLWLRRNVDGVATFAIPVGYTYQVADVSASGLAETHQAHRISVGGGIRDYSDQVHMGWLEGVGLTWSTIQISNVGGLSAPDSDIKVIPTGDEPDVHLQQVDLRLANFDDYVFQIPLGDTGENLVLGCGAWLGASWAYDEAGNSEGIFAYHWTERIRAGNEDFTLELGLGHDRQLRHDVVGARRFIEYLVEGIVGGHSERLGFGAETRVAARWLLDIGGGDDPPAAVAIASDAWLTVWGPLDLGFYHRADQLPTADQRSALPWRHEAGLFVRAAYDWQ